MKRLAALISIGLLPCSLFAATLETVVNALALPASATYSANDWPSTNAIAGIRWSHKGLRETPDASFGRSGKLKLQGLGNSRVSFSGARTMIFQLDVDVHEGEGNVFEKEAFTSVLKSQFSNLTAIKPIRGGCKNDGEMSGSAVYQVTPPKNKPVYVMVSTDAGGNSPDSRTSSFQFSLENEDRWRCTN